MNDDDDFDEPTDDRPGELLSPLTVDFWFEPPPSLDDAFWPVALAVCWISWRDRDTSADRYENFLSRGRMFWLACDESPGPTIKPREAEKLLLEALRTGTVSAFGLDGDGRREHIGNHLWIDMRLHGPKPGDRLENAVREVNAKVLFADLRIAGADVLAAWPPHDHEREGIAVRKRRGPSPDKSIRVRDAMLALDPDKLRTMKIASLAAEFGVSEPLCRAARKAVLASKSERSGVEAKNKNR